MAEEAITPRPLETYLQPNSFGNGESSIDHPELLQMKDSDRFRILGHYAACPIQDTVWHMYSELGEEAKEWIQRRYESTNAITKHIVWERAKEVNPDLYKILTTSHLRNPEELPVKFEAQSVPESHTVILSPMGQLSNYSASRILVLMGGIDTSKNLTSSDYIDIITSNEDVMKRLDESLANARSAEEFSARLAGQAWDMGINAVSILEHTLEDEKLLEERYGETALKIVRLMDKDPLANHIADVYWAIEWQSQNKEREQGKPKISPIMEYIADHPTLPTTIEGPTRAGWKPLAIKTYPLVKGALWIKSR